MLLLVRPLLPLRLLLELELVLFSHLTGLGAGDCTKRVSGIRTSGIVRSATGFTGTREKKLTDERKLQ